MTQPPSADMVARFDILSPQMQRIARRVADGQTAKGIARDLGLALSTVSNHVCRMYRKLGIGRRDQLVSIVRAIEARDNVTLPRERVESWRRAIESERDLDDVCAEMAEALA